VSKEIHENIKSVLLNSNFKLELIVENEY